MQVSEYISRAEWSGTRIDTIDPADEKVIVRLQDQIRELAPGFDFSKDATKKRLKAFPELCAQLEKHTRASKYMWQYMQTPVEMRPLPLDVDALCRPFTALVQTPASVAVGATAARAAAPTAPALAQADLDIFRDDPPPLSWVPLPVPVGAWHSQLRSLLADETVHEEKLYAPFEATRKFAPNDDFAPSLANRQQQVAPLGNAKPAFIRYVVPCAHCSKPRAVTCDMSLNKLQREVRRERPSTLFWFAVMCRCGLTST